MASQETPNYRLSRWAGTDRILMEEFNSDNEKIDAALKANADAAAAAAAALAEAGNCRMELTTYTGTGTYGKNNPVTISFREMPFVFIIKGPNSFMIARGGERAGTLCVVGEGSGVVTDNTLTWSGNSFSMTDSYDAKYVLNTKSGAYWVLAFYKTK